MPKVTNGHEATHPRPPALRSGKAALPAWGRTATLFLLGCAAAACTGRARAYGAGAQGFVGGGNIHCSPGPERVVDGGPWSEYAYAPTRHMASCGYRGYAFGEADLSPGFLKAYAEAAGQGHAQGHSWLDINVNLQGPRGATRVVDTWDMVISGVLSEPIRPPWYYTDVVTSTWEACISANVPGMDGFVRSAGCDKKNFGNGAFSQTIALDIDAPAVDGRVDGIYVRFSITASAAGLLAGGVLYSGKASLDHTAWIRQTLPPGWTYTSDSSVFLSTSPLSPVPEHASIGLLGCCLALLARRRQRLTGRPNVARGSGLLHEPSSVVTGTGHRSPVPEPSAALLRCLGAGFLWALRAGRRAARSLRVPCLTGAALLCAATASQAGLIDRGGGLIYDTALDITWLQDANLARTRGDDTDGLMPWAQAVAWADKLTYHDSVRKVSYSDWRLPGVAPINGTQFDVNLSFDGSTDFGFGFDRSGASKNSEMAHLYHHTLGGASWYLPSGVEVGCTPCLVYTDPFVNLQSGPDSLGGYWSGTPLPEDPARAFYFAMYFGMQAPVDKGSELYAWAVRSGDVAAVPEPPAVVTALLALAMLSLRARRLCARTPPAPGRAALAAN